MPCQFMSEPLSAQTIYVWYSVADRGCVLMFRAVCKPGYGGVNCASSCGGGRGLQAVSTILKYDCRNNFGRL